MKSLASAALFSFISRASREESQTLIGFYVESEKSFANRENWAFNCQQDIMLKCDALWNAGDPRGASRFCGFSSEICTAGHRC